MARLVPTMVTPGQVVDGEPPGTHRRLSLDLKLDTAREVDAVLHAWRARALGVVLWVAVGFLLVPLAALLAGKVIVLPWAVRGLCLVMYLAVLVVAWRRDWSVHVRAGVLLGCVATTSAIQLAIAQLEGSGRISLFVLPFLAVIFVSSRAGWAALGAGTVLLGMAPLALQAGLLSGIGLPFAVGTPLEYWWMQWLQWVNIALALTILLTRFERLQRRSLIAERLAWRRSEADAADRQRLEMEVHRVGEAERRRLGAELHDGLCQHLTATLLNCSAVENRGQCSAGSDDLARIRESIEEAIDIAYDVARGLSPVDIGPQGLVSALEQLCRGVQTRHHVGCHLQVQPGLEFHHPERALQLYRIAGEAVANAVKHSRGAAILVELLRDGGDLVLRVSDDGPHAGPAPAKAGLGMDIMAYRAGLMGGGLQVETLPAAGTRVTCRLPWRDTHLET